MNALTNRKWDGIISIAWACGGLLVLKFSDFHSDSPTLRFFILFGAWWGIAMLLAVSGLRSGSLPSVLTGFVTVVLFIYFLWIDLIPYHGSSRARIPAAISQIASFETALDAFRADNGFYPTGTNGLQDLVRQPAGTTNWHGPYVDVIPNDPWGRKYVYECPGKHTTSGYPYDLFSLGPTSGKDAIVNWTHVKP